MADVSAITLQVVCTIDGVMFARMTIFEEEDEGKEEIEIGREETEAGKGTDLDKDSDEDTGKGISGISNSSDTE